MEVADRLHSAAIHLLRRVRKQDTRAGVGPAQLSALSVLVFGGAHTLGQLAAAEQVKPPTMTRVVKGLERTGLVTRFADRNDGRRIQIRPTPKGARLLQQARKRRIEHLARQLAARTKQELSALDEASRILEELLKHWA